MAVEGLSRIERVGQGGRYPNAIIAFVRAMWASGEFETDSDLAEKLGLPPEQGRVLIYRWRRDNKPDGIPWQQFKDEADAGRRAMLASVIGEKQADIAERQLGIAQFLESRALSFLTGKILYDENGNPVPMPVSDIRDVDQALRCLTTGLAIQDRVMTRDLSGAEKQAKLRMLEERARTLPRMNDEQRAEFTDFILRMIRDQDAKKRRGEIEKLETEVEAAEWEDGDGDEHVEAAGETEAEGWNQETDSEG